MIAVVDAPSSPSKASLASVERYGDEIRETYLNRLDKLTFRVDDGNNEHRFFENGRVDYVKQVIENHVSHSRVVKYAQRPDGCTEFARNVDKESHGQILTAEYSGRADGILSVAIALQARQRLDVGSDSAISLIREKSLHIAVKLNPEIAVGKFLEVYQDHDSRELRVVTRDDEFGKRQTHSFSNDTPTDDPRYEMAKIMIVGASKMIVDLERELHLNLFPFAAGDSNEDLIDKQRQRLHALAGSLFTAFDEASIASQRHV